MFGKKHRSKICTLPFERFIRVRAVVLQEVESKANTSCWKIMVDGRSTPLWPIRKFGRKARCQIYNFIHPKFRIKKSEKSCSVLSSEFQILLAVFCPLRSAFGKSFCQWKKQNRFNETNSIYYEWLNMRRMRQYSALVVHFDIRVCTFSFILLNCHK